MALRVSRRPCRTILGGAPSHQHIHDRRSFDGDQPARRDVRWVAGKSLCSVKLEGNDALPLAPGIRCLVRLQWNIPGLSRMIRPPVKVIDPT